MKRLIVFIISLCMAVGLVGCSVNNDASTDESNKTGQTTIDSSIVNAKSIVVYFSRTNNTKKIANYVIEITGSDKYEIEAKNPYTDADINYNDSASRATKEQRDPSARPEIGSDAIDLSEYGVIYLGYPIWWGEAPKIMYTFVESYDLSGKTIIPFCTSASSGIGSSAANLSKASTGATWKSGRRFSASATESDVRSWIGSIK